VVDSPMREGAIPAGRILFQGRGKEICFTEPL
jgi:hypothetical protein